MIKKVPILTYHSIDDSGSVISTPVHKFQEQMDILKKKGFDIIALKDLVPSIRKKQSLPDQAAVITFDDGFNNVFDIAYPILKEYRFPATVFLVPEYCGKKNQWESQPAGIPAFDLMNWENIEVMANDGIDFGAHTMTHANLSLLSERQATYEIVKSQSMIQKHLGKDVAFFAYPYGGYTKQTKKLVQQNYIAACSTALGFVSKKSDNYALPRIDMYYFSRNNLFDCIGTSKYQMYIQFRAILRFFRGIIDNGSTNPKMNQTSNEF